MISVDGDKLTHKYEKLSPDKACSQDDGSNGHLILIHSSQTRCECNVSAPWGNLTFRVELIYSMGQDAHSTPLEKNLGYYTARSRVTKLGLVTPF